LPFNRYFEDELTYLRQLGKEFANAYPQLAPMLTGPGGDPDVDRLLEGVAFLTGRIRQKIDDEFPELIYSVAALLFPQLVSPLPAASILEISPIPNVLRGPRVLPAGTEFGSVKVRGEHSCTFRSSADCELLPWKLDVVRLEPVPGGLSQLRLELQTEGSTPVEQILPERVRLHLADEARYSLLLLSSLLHHVGGVTLYNAEAPHETVEIGSGSIVPWGFEENQALLPLPEATFPGFRLLQEYFTLPSKFSFVEIKNLRKAKALSPSCKRLGLLIRFSSPFSLSDVGLQHVRLHCVPIVNVFQTTAEPLRITPQREEYLVRPAGLPPGSGEVFSVVKVDGAGKYMDGPSEVLPFFDFQHVARMNATARTYYTIKRSPSTVGDGCDVTLSLGSSEDSTGTSGIERLSLDLLATNGPLANALGAGEIRMATPTSPPFATFRNLQAVTRYVPVPRGRDLQWRVMAHSAMNLRSLTELAALRSALAVYDIRAIIDRQAARASQLRIEGVRSVVVTPADKLYRGAPVRGILVEVELDDSGFAGDGDIHLFGSVLERLFASYVSINSYAQTKVRTLHSKMEFSWPARSGSTILV
jgi:type VI secretion system protein ImpG